MCVSLLPEWPLDAVSTRLSLWPLAKPENNQWCMRHCRVVDSPCVWIDPCWDEQMSLCVCVPVFVCVRMRHTLSEGVCARYVSRRGAVQHMGARVHKSHRDDKAWQSCWCCEVSAIWCWSGGWGEKHIVLFPSLLHSLLRLNSTPHLSLPSLCVSLDCVSLLLTKKWASEDELMTHRHPHFPPSPLFLWHSHPDPHINYSNYPLLNLSSTWSPPTAPHLSPPRRFLNCMLVCMCVTEGWWECVFWMFYFGSVKNDRWGKRNEFQPAAERMVSRAQSDWTYKWHAGKRYWIIWFNNCFYQPEL